jgi:hypothetical protein
VEKSGVDELRKANVLPGRLAFGLSRRGSGVPARFVDVDKALGTRMTGRGRVKHVLRC